MLANLLKDIHQSLRFNTDRGKVAQYIPQLSHVDPSYFGIAVATVDGEVFQAGDAKTPFSIQSISKVFTLMMALEKMGKDTWQYVGREPSGNPFNSIVQLEQEQGRPRNPFINAGAIAVADLVLNGITAQECILKILSFVRILSGDDQISIDESVALSEKETGDRNASLAHFMSSFGRLNNPVNEILNVYFHHCAIAMSCHQLARAGLSLAKQQNDDSSIIPKARARRINSLMLLCGNYDGSGEFAFRIGLPSKSGVGGGILAIVPGKASIAVWSPGLNKVGSSHLGMEALAMLVQETGWSVFGS